MSRIYYAPEFLRSGRAITENLALQIAGRGNGDGKGGDFIATAGAIDADRRTWTLAFHARSGEQRELGAFESSSGQNVFAEIEELRRATWPTIKAFR